MQVLAKLGWALVQVLQEPGRITGVQLLILVDDFGFKTGMKQFPMNPPFIAISQEECHAVDAKAAGVCYRQQA